MLQEVVVTSYHIFIFLQVMLKGNKVRLAILYNLLVHLVSQFHSELL